MNFAADSRRRSGPGEASGASSPESVIATVIARLLRQAKLAIESDNRRVAVAAMFIARERYDVSQQRIAAAVGKSQPWVSGMFRWYRKGFNGTPFGQASKDARMVVCIGRSMPRKWPRGLVRRWVRRTRMGSPPYYGGHQ